VNGKTAAVLRCSEGNRQEPDLPSAEHAQGRHESERNCGDDFPDRRTPERTRSTTSWRPSPSNPTRRPSSAGAGCCSDGPGLPVAWSVSASSWWRPLVAVTTIGMMRPRSNRQPSGGRHSPAHHQSAWCAWADYLQANPPEQTGDATLVLRSTVYPRHHADHRRRPLRRQRQVFLRADQRRPAGGGPRQPRPGQRNLRTRDCGGDLRRQR